MVPDQDRHFWLAQYPRPGRRDIQPADHGKRTGWDARVGDGSSSADGDPTNNVFFIGSNPDPETRTSYISAADCGTPDPVPVADIGFPDMHYVINVNGSCPAGSPTPTATATATPTATATATATGTPTATATPTTTVPPRSTPTPRPRHATSTPISSSVSWLDSGTRERKLASSCLWMDGNVHVARRAHRNVVSRTSPKESGLRGTVLIPVITFAPPRARLDLCNVENASGPSSSIRLAGSPSAVASADSPKAWAVFPYQRVCALLSNATLHTRLPLFKEGVNPRFAP